MVTRGALMLKPTMQVGDWVVVRALAEGGMGSVFLARNRMSERVKVALKVVKPSDMDGAEGRFVREAEALYTLRDPAIVRVMGFGFDDTLGALWLAMELVDGINFVDLMQQGPLDPDRAARMFGRIASGLAHAHEVGIQHRDIKPANLMVRIKDDQPVIVDFGISLEEGRTKLTAVGLVPGTMAYMPPEVFDGEPDAVAGDIYALGLVLYEALTGETSFPEDSRLSGNARMARLMAAKLSEKTFDLGGGFPAHLRELVMRATSADPAARLGSMVEFAAGCKAPPRSEQPIAPANASLQATPVSSTPAPAEL
ncbi:MAG: serine/threonine protein kinase, partial [Kiritimatiellia bacterium]